MDRGHGAPEWEVRDIVGHIVDTTETDFQGFHAARSHTEVEAAYGLVGMAKRAEEQGKSFRDLRSRRRSSACAPTSTR